VEWLFAIAGAVMGAVGAWLVLRTREAALAERARSSVESVAKLEAELAAHRARVLELETSAAGLRARLEELADAKARLTDTFNSAAANALKGNTEQFLKLAQEHLGKIQEGAKGDLEKRQQAIDSLVKPIKDSLEKVDSKINELEKARASAYGQLSEQLKSLTTTQGQLQAEAAKLSTALRSTTTAGTWGELQLRRVVELAGMTSYCDFTEQESSGAFRPDLVVRLPGGQQIVVDAKAPNDAYREAANASDDSVRTAKLAEHATKVRNHVDALGAKDYWAQFQPAPEFVVLFLPGDQFLAGALQSDPTLIDRAIAKKVLLATPATLIALLKATAYGWRQEAVSKNAEEISKLGRDLHDRIATFAGHLDRVRKGLGGAVGALNDAVGSYERSVLPGARKFKELGVSGTKEIPEIDPIDESLREINAPDAKPD